MVLEVVKKYGTPVYIYDGNIIMDKFKTIRNSLPDYIDIYYSLKANPNISITRLLSELGAKAEVCSLTELMTALRAGVENKNIIFLGPGKSIGEIKESIEHEIFAIVCESLEEIEIVDKISNYKNKITNILIRVNPSFTVKGTKLTMGGKPRQFGIDEEIILNNRTLFRNFKNINILGFHAYMGTRILSESTICENTRKILDLSKRLSEQLDIDLKVVDIGGGLGVPYFDKEKSLDIYFLGQEMTKILEQFHLEYPNVQLIMELGRFLVAESGMLVSEILYKKKSMGKNFLVTNAGTNVHMAAAGLGSFIKRNFPITSIKLDDSKKIEKEVYNITGPLCTPNDTVGIDVELPILDVKDLIVILNSGAYGPTASPTNFLGHGFPAEVLVIGENMYLIREKDTPEDLISKQRLVNFNLKYTITE